MTLFGQTCQHTFNKKKIEEREWTHFCFLISDKIQKMYIGKDLYEWECKKDFSFPTVTAEYSRILGGVGLYDGNLPFSGEVADLRLYQKHLSMEEVQMVSEIKEIAGTPLGFNLPTFNINKELKDIKDAVEQVVNMTQVTEVSDTVEQVVKKTQVNDESDTVEQDL